MIFLSTSSIILKEPDCDFIEKIQIDRSQKGHNDSRRTSLKVNHAPGHTPNLTTTLQIFLHLPGPRPDLAENSTGQIT